MIAIVLTSHGEFAKGILQSATMILGEQEKVVADIFKPGEGPEDLKKRFDQSLAEFDETDQVLFLCDLWGGTPFNQASQIVAQNSDRMALITGLNLPMLVESYTYRDQPLDEVVSHLEEVGREGIKHLDLSSLNDEEGDDLL
ncbi:PTS sugar transporter subunit IIA [Levilactobacillus bambusae]|uniref:PTS mannose transporter subunit IIA n=1 Tax=Levilactobacillus bambusae TaxID=2024736 RepID=A0A2V1MWG1_9LACO|nr:PTS sugar transporter subunit IIA [Levilactobacillus bambusae]PWF99406.1 PTS mannose transporter subunit IIA [Levilactobacillus bambusae]